MLKTYAIRNKKTGEFVGHGKWLKFVTDFPRTYTKIHHARLSWQSWSVWAWESFDLDKFKDLEIVEFEMIETATHPTEKDK